VPARNPPRHGHEVRDWRAHSAHSPETTSVPCCRFRTRPEPAVMPRVDTSAGATVPPDPGAAGRRCVITGTTIRRAGVARERTARRAVSRRGGGAAGPAPPVPRPSPGRGAYSPLPPRSAARAPWAPAAALPPAPSARALRQVARLGPLAETRCRTPALRRICSRWMDLFSRGLFRDERALTAGRSCAAVTSSCSAPA